MAKTASTKGDRRVTDETENGVGGTGSDLVATQPPTEPPLSDAAKSRLAAIVQVARHYGAEIDPAELNLVPGSNGPSDADMVAWAKAAGLAADARKVAWRFLLKNQMEPIILLLTDGSAALLSGVRQDENLVFLRDPRSGSGELPTPVDELRLRQIWQGQIILVRPSLGHAPEDQPFDFRWIFNLVMIDRTLVRDISIASIGIAIIGTLPALMVMMVLDKVMEQGDVNTLIFIGAMFFLLWLLEAVLAYGSQIITAHLGARVDTRVHLHLFTRLLALPLDYFERNPAGQTAHRLQQTWQIRRFVTSTLLGSILNFFTLCVVLPVLYYITPVLTWFTLVAAIATAVIVFSYLRPLRRIFGRVVVAEIQKSTVMVETLHGIRTVKCMVLEPQQRDVWDAKVARASKLRLEGYRLAVWPQVLSLPFQRFAERGTLLVGALMAVQDPTSITIGQLVAVLLLGGRLSEPMMNLARVMQDMEELRAAIMMISWTIDNPVEVTSRMRGLTPNFVGAITFDHLSFTYPGSKSRALDDLCAEIPAGTMMGLVGRSGSGKSTVARLLQGISRGYEGYLKVDGIDLREIQLGHLRRSFGVVLQDNFLFRGSIRDNILASRPGYTFKDVIRAASLAGAQEFIERLPKGYETIIEEGSANLSGGQRQRIAIARALITDPRLLILDEATSALDPESEALVNANLKLIGEGRTMVIVSHRLASLLDCHLTMVLERGRLLDLAPHSVLLERCATYRTLWHQQNRHLAPASAQQGPASLGPVLAN